MTAIKRVSACGGPVHTDIADIANASFGAGYMTVKRVAKMLREPGAFYISCSGDIITGYCVFLYETAEACAAKLKIPPSALRGFVSGDSDIVCHTKSMAIRPEYRRTGQAERLFAACLKDAEEHGVKSAWGSAWKIGNAVPMDSIFRSNGFSVYGEVPLIWFEDKGYSCIVCEGPCRCTGVIYYKAL